MACADINFELYPGEILGIVGESGSGKSTVIKLLAFDVEPLQGEYYIKHEKIINILGNGQKNLFNLTPFEKRQIRNQVIGIVYQYPYLGLKMNISAGGNIAENLLVAGLRNLKRIREKVLELFEKTELPIQRIDEPPIKFSGGMQQRVQIAKALSNNPPVLFLDEVTTGLDVSVKARILDLIKNLHHDYNFSIIIVSHDLSIIRVLTHRTIVMKLGRVVEAGLTDQILEDPQHPYTQLLVNSQL
ncbi:MAG: ATP-binding cassette domain-containing protein [Caldimicrobium sp.]|nr:ATP-binding cassette domain-containing protein [Caldimicrobium sp.]MDW8094769.1 ATP-binding cassette domain-containing protein [Caldimicrobium sp.]